MAPRVTTGQSATVVTVVQNPNEHGKKSASKTGYVAIFTAACTIRSQTAGIENGRRSPEPGFGMWAGGMASEQ